MFTILDLKSEYLTLLDANWLGYFNISQRASAGATRDSDLDEVEGNLL
jgi:hypothetical protein